MGATRTQKLVFLTRTLSALAVSGNGLATAYAAQASIPGPDGTFRGRYSLKDLLMRTSHLAVVGLLFGLLVAAPQAHAALAPGQTCTIIGTVASETIQGTPGSDVICGMGGNDKIFGNGGSDALHGGAGDDTLTGADGNDFLFGDGGNDVMRPNGGANFLDGGEGVYDTLDYSTYVYPAEAYQTQLRSTTVHLGLVLGGPPMIAGPAWGGRDGKDRLVQLSTERVIGTSDADHVVGSNQDNWFDLGDGPDGANGRGGNDTFVEHTLDGDDVYTGESGTDLLTYAASSLAVTQAPGTFLNPVSSTLDEHEFAGSRLTSVGSPDRQDGGVGGGLPGGVVENPDVPTGSPSLPVETNEDLAFAMERLVGSSADDRLAGVEGTTIEGGPGNDILYGTGKQVGGDGQDELHGNSGVNQVLDCGTGSDRFTTEKPFTLSAGGVVTVAASHDTVASCESPTGSSSALHATIVQEHNGRPNTAIVRVYNVGLDQAPAGAPFTVRAIENAAELRRYPRAIAMGAEQQTSRPDDTTPTCVDDSPTATTCRLSSTLSPGRVAGVALWYADADVSTYGSPDPTLAASAAAGQQDTVVLSMLPAFEYGDVSVAWQLLPASPAMKIGQTRDLKLWVVGDMTDPINQLRFKITVPAGLQLRGVDSYNQTDAGGWACESGFGNVAVGATTMTCEYPFIGTGTTSFNLKVTGLLPGQHRLSVEANPNAFSPTRIDTNMANNSAGLVIPVGLF